MTVLISQGLSCANRMALFLLHRRGVMTAPFLLSCACLFWDGAIFQIRFSRFVPSIVDLVHTERKKLAQLCKRSSADALEKR